jgi:hypothetical protein
MDDGPVMSLSSVAFTVVAIYCIRVALDLWDPVPIPTTPRVTHELAMPADDEEEDGESTSGPD